MKVFSAQQIRILEANADRAGLSYRAMMEQAGRAVFERLLRDYGKERRYLILCGKGNNGGDGFVIAELLHRVGAKVDAVLVQGAPVTEDALEMYRRCKEIRVSVWEQAFEEQLTRAEVIVECVFGIGFHGELPEGASALFAKINKLSAVKIAVDLPGGCDCAGSFAAENAFRADRTFSFHSLKPVHIEDATAPFCGKIEVLSLKLPPESEEGLTALYEVITSAEIADLLPPRPEESNKGTFGSGMALCGCYGMAGAAKLATWGGLRCGAGLIHLLLPKSIYLPVASEITEAVFHPLEENAAGRASAQESDKILSIVQKGSALLVGCGWGVDEDTDYILREILRKTKMPLVLDADGINLLAKHINEYQAEDFAARQVIITPHPGEFSRLLGCSIAEIQSHRLEYARAFAAKYGMTVVLKGHHTVIASPDGRLALNCTGNAGMAKGGSGDLLAGMILSLLTQGMDSWDACRVGVYLHGRAGDLCAERLSQRGMLPTDMVKALPDVWKELE